MSVAQILNEKGRHVFTVKLTDSVQAVAKLLTEKKIGAVVVLSSEGKPKGIVSERDIVRHLASDGAGLLSKPVSNIMTSALVTCSDADSEADLMSLMTKNRIRHLPVVTDGKLSGMISIGDVVKYRMEAIEHEAQDLKNYIASAG